MSDHPAEPASGQRRDLGPGQPRARRDRPDPAEGLLLLVVVMLLIVMAGQPLQAASIISGLLATEWLMIGLPVGLFVWVGRLRAQEVLALRRPSPRALLGAAMAASSGWYLIGVLVEQLQRHVLPLPPEALEQLRRLLFEGDRPWAVDVLALALSPACCEELLFRGFLLRARPREMGTPWAVVTNALLFGAFHLSVHRFLPTAALGAVLALLVLRTGSIVPAMLFHLLNNTAALLVGRLADTEGPQIEAHIGWLVVAGVVFAAGLAIALGGPTRQGEQGEGS